MAGHRRWSGRRELAYDLLAEMGEGYHTVNDTIDLLEGEYSFEHLQRFVKLVSV